MVGIFREVKVFFNNDLTQMHVSIGFTNKPRKDFYSSPMSERREKVEGEFGTVDVLGKARPFPKTPAIVPRPRSPS